MKLLSLVFAWPLFPVVALTTHQSIRSVQKDDDAVDTETATFEPQPPPLKVFIMAGQSNMQGHGYIHDIEKDTGAYKNGTLEWMVDTYPTKYKKLKTINGTAWKERSDVWIAYNREEVDEIGINMHQYGSLTTAYGGDPRQKPNEHMGPELGFGWTVGDAMQDQQILLIKIAWGGKSLAVDYRPPSSGGVTGPCYKGLVSHTLKTLDRLDELFPGYSNIGNYELAGFIWHQGWNDAYLKNPRNLLDDYEFNLVNLIRDIRKDLDDPYLPVTIGVSGMHGNDILHTVADAQLAVADPKKYPEFDGTVSSVQTRDFLRPPFPDGSPGKEGYHWNNNCETFWLIGEAMGEAAVKLMYAKSINT